MTQRNPMNERYTTDKQLGKTRKSAASAKPTATRAATVRDPAPKSKKQKKAEQRERERRLAEKRGVPAGQRGGVYDVPTDEYRKWRRRWWIALGIGIAFAVPSFLFGQFGLPSWAVFVFLGCSWAALITALWIDMGKMRKIRKNYNAQAIVGKSKEARAQQKARAAELREQRKEAEEAAKKAAEEAANNPQPQKKGLLGRFMKPKAAPAPEADSAADEAAKDSA